MAGVEEGAAPGLGVGDPLEFTVESLHVVRDAESVKEEELQGLRLQMRQKKFHFSVWTLSAKVSLKLTVQLAVTVPVRAQVLALMSRSFQGLRCMLTQKTCQME